MGWWRRCVCDLIDPQRKNKRRATIYTAQQVAQLLGALKGEPIEPIITLIVATGCRLGEALALKWSEVDLDRATVTIHTGRAEVIGGYADSEPKTDAGNRIIPIPARVVSHLRDHRKAQLERRLWLGEVWEESDYVFPNEIGGAQQHSVPERRFKKLLARWTATCSHSRSSPHRRSTDARARRAGA